MSLPVFDPQTHLFGLQARSSDVFSEKDRYRLFAEKVYPLLVEARPKLEACYCLSDGRPAVEPVLLLGVSVLQFLERVWNEQFEVGEGHRVVRQTEIPATPVQNPHDPEAQWCTKKTGDGKKEWVGYKTQVAETVPEALLQKGEPTSAFITGMVTQPATGSDEAGLGEILKQQAEMGLDQPAELYVDGAYVSGQALAEAEAEGRQLMGPAQPPAKTGKSAFKSDAFDIEVEQRRATCPGGHASTQCSRLEEEKTGKVNYRFEWSTHCQDCRLRAQCVPDGQKHRTLVVGQYHTPLQARRRQMKTAEFQQQMKQRNAIEGTHSELVRAHGLRRARYRGLKKVALQNYLIGAACNVKRWIRRMQWEIKQGMQPGPCVPQVS